MHTVTVKLKQSTHQARRQGEFEGVRSKPPFGLRKILYAPHILSALPFEVGPVASPPSKQPAWNARESCLRRCDEGTRVDKATVNEVHVSGHSPAHR